MPHQYLERPITNLDSVDRREALVFVEVRWATRPYELTLVTRCGKDVGPVRHQRGLLWSFCAVALAAASCSEDGGGSAGAGGDGAGGGVAGHGGGGVSGFGGMIFEDLDSCPNDEEDFTGLSYESDNGTFVGREALHELSADCLFGNEPNLTASGCGDEVGETLADNTEVTRATLTACVERCVLEHAPELLELPAGCVLCWAEERTCQTAFCAGPCATVGCDFCLCDNNCPEEFLLCSGFPSRTTCPPDRSSLPSLVDGLSNDGEVPRVR